MEQSITDHYKSLFQNVAYCDACILSDEISIGDFIVHRVTEPNISKRPSGDKNNSCDKWTIRGKGFFDGFKKA